jgi:hypothetical protein
MVDRRPLLPYVVAAAIALVCATPSGSAPAQSSTPPLSVAEIQFCMCMDQYIDAARPEIEAHQAMRVEQQGRLDLLEAEIDVMQGSIDPNNVSQQEQLKSKIYQANQLRDQIRRQFGPEYNMSLREFNTAVRSYNENCANRRMVKVDVTAAASTLSCPAVVLP